MIQSLGGLSFLAMYWNAVNVSRAHPFPVSHAVLALALFVFPPPDVFGLPFHADVVHVPPSQM